MSARPGAPVGIRRILARPSSIRALLALLVIGVFGSLLPSPARATPADINGQGSSYVALAMQQWVADGQTNGLSVNYTPSNSVAGLTSFGGGQMDFAATEAEFSALGQAEPYRGYQYVPDVAGAISVMYNVQDKAGRKIDYLNLSRRTIGRIFTGDITSWSHPDIAKDNPLPDGGLLELPDQAINVVYRSGQSGTTALFYDFVAHVVPDIFGPWAAKNRYPTDYRIIQLDSSPTFAPKTMPLGGSDQIAQHIGSGGGLWSIGYDEFGYAKTYDVPSAWVENESGNWVQPYAENIAEALRTASLRQDLSQELSGVYTSPNPKAYPISAYSYIVTQCAESPERPSCKGKYTNEGIAETLTPWLRYVACEGQVNMARIGYSPLPAELSQEVANAIGRLNGTAPEVLTAENCANPRFRGEIFDDGGPPVNPVRPPDDANVDLTDVGGGGATTGGATGPAAAEVTALDESAAVGAKKSAGGGSGNWESAAPVPYENVSSESVPMLPMVLMLAAIVLVPPAAFGFGARRRRANGMAGPRR